MKAICVLATIFKALLLLAGLSGCHRATAGTVTDHFESTPQGEKSAPREEVAPKDEEVWYGLLAFTCRSCVPCGLQNREYKKLQGSGWGFERYGEGKRAHIAIVDTDEHPEIAAKYRVEKVPCHIAVHGAEECDRREGVLTAARLIDLWKESRGNAKASAMPASDLLSSLLASTGNGTFQFTLPAAVDLGDGRSLNPGPVTGRAMVANGRAAVIFDQPRPRVLAKILGKFRVGADVQAIDYEPPVAIVRTTAGRYRIRMEPLQN